MGLTREDLDALKAHFATDEHEFDYRKNVYIKEYPISERLDSVDPSWSLSEPKIFWRNGLVNGLVVEVTVVLTVCGISRGGLGRKTVEITKDGKGEGNQAAKAAATDAFKRAARLFGIGRYLLTAPTKVKDTKTLGNWLRQQKVQAPESGHPAEFDEATWKNEIMKLTYDLYLDANGKYNSFHQTGSLKKALETGTIKTSQNAILAAAMMLIHRIETDYGYDAEDVQFILGSADEPKTVGDCLREGQSIGDVWKAVQAEYQALREAV